MKRLIKMTSLAFFVLGGFNILKIFNTNKNANVTISILLGVLFIGIGIALMYIKKLPIFNKKREIVKRNEKKDANFEMIYKSIHLKYEGVLKKAKLKEKYANIIFTLLGTFYISIGGLILFKDGREVLTTCMHQVEGLPMKIILATIVLLGAAYAMLVSYTKQYKMTVVKELIDKTNNNLKFSLSSIDNGRELTRHYETINLDRFSKIDLRQTFAGVRQYVESKTEDYIEGKISDTASLKMAEVTIDEVKETNEHKTKNTVFNGLFAHVNMVNVCPAEIMIFTSNLNIIRNKKENNIVCLDDSENWKKMSVYSEQSSAAKNILTEELGKIISKHIRDTKVRTDIILRGNNVYIRFHEHDVFEPSEDENENRYKLYTYYKILNFIDSFVKELEKTINS